MKAAYSVGARKCTGEQKETESRGPAVPFSDELTASPTGGIQIWIQLIRLLSSI